MSNELYFNEQGRQKLVDGITKISSAVKSTLGPRGKTVLIESQNHVHGITVTKDGVTVAKSITLEDPVENLAVRMMKEAADRTATTAGDGTTTAIVLTEAMVNRGTEFITSKNNPTMVLREVNNIVDGVVKTLEKKAKKVKGKTLRDVASISANNDRELGDIIADAYSRVGNEGMVTVDDSQSDKTYSEVTNGIRVERGYTSRLFVNDMKKEECIMDDVYVMVTDQEVSNILSIENVLKPIVQGKKKLLIIGPCTNNVINTLAANVMQNDLKFCNIQAPQFGYKQQELMQDIAFALGATYFSEQTGDDLSLMTMEHLGRAKRVIVGRDSTVIVRNEETSEAVKERVAQLWAQHDNTERKNDRDAIKERIASLTGGVGVIYVGGGSGVEQKERKDRVDDAVCAVRSALEEGILPGGGVALYNAASDIIAYASDSMEHISDDQYTAMQIVGWALQAPLIQIMDNAGLDGHEVMTSVTEDGSGYDVKNECYGDMMAMGVIDPLKVTKSALKNAVSVATTILSTNAIVTIKR